jgi:hypothetical protein
MTKVISRLVADADAANALARRIRNAGFPPRDVLAFAPGEEGAEAAMAEAGVAAETVQAYAAKMGEGNAVVVVRATYKPLEAPRIAREMMAAANTVDAGGVPEETTVVDKFKPMGSVLTEHPLFLSRRRDPEDTNYYMISWPGGHISRRKPRPVTDHSYVFGRKETLISRIKPRDEFAFPRHARMANFIFPLTIRRAPTDNFIFPRHARMANWPIPLINRRKPAGKTLMRGKKWANWPFPHLINGERGKNSLMPGAPRMAGGAGLPLISDRKPFTGSLFPKHARMANMLLPLTNRRKPFTKSIFPKHARMAKFLLPLTTRRRTPGKGLFGLPTLIQR